MLPESVERKVEEVATDHQSGATHVAIRALRAFDLLVAAGGTDAGTVRELRERLDAAQPAMASVRNAARLAEGQLTRGAAGWPTFRDALLRQLEEGRRRVAGNFVQVVPSNATVLTLSRSVNVFECCVVAAQRGRITKILVLESRPGSEGYRLAEDLREAHVEAEAVPDETVQSHVGPSVVGLAGADTVFADGAVVNKVGTRALAEACRRADRPMYVACETIKFDAMPSSQAWKDSAQHSGLFDLTPPNLVTGFVTERGVWRPDQVASLISRTR